MTQRIAERRDLISELWHANAHVWLHKQSMGFQTEDQYFAFCVSKDWIQDTAEALIHHRASDFSSDPLKAYLEFWGVLQAVFVQQDAIKELWFSFEGTRELDPQPALDSAWAELRDLRNLAVGHPVKNTQSKIAKAATAPARCVSGRQPRSYKRIPLTWYVDGSIKNEAVDLGALIDRYDIEASAYLEKCHLKLEARLKQ